MAFTSDKQIGALQLSTNWSASKLRLQHIIRPSLGHRPLFISTLFGNVLWTDLDRRREILDVCEVHGFTPEYVDEPLSNTAITLAALTVSPLLGAVSLGFLVVVHKLEYFLNARIVGDRIRVPAYGLLASMLVLEAAFGVAGLVAAPIYCAWLMRELRGGNWL